MPASSDPRSHDREPISRRRVIQAGAALGAGLALSSLAAADSALPLITKPIPSTGEKLPVIGIGTNEFGVSDPEEIAARREVIRELPHLGGKLIDTAAAYGESESVIGKLVKELGNRDQLFLATKTPMGGASVASVDQALERLQIGKLDLLQIHNFVHLDDLLPVLLNAKKAGKVRYVGVTTAFSNQHPQMLEAIKSQPLDFVQVDYNIQDRAAEEIIHAAHDKGLAVLANVPLGGRGRSILPRVANRPLPDWAKELDATSWPQVLLKYIVSHPGVTATIPGTTKLAHLQDNQLAGRGRLPDAALRKKIEDFWAGLS